MSKSKIPPFTSYEEEAAFWDAHDFTDVADETMQVPVSVSANLAQEASPDVQSKRREELAAVIKTIQAENANSPAAQMDEDEFMDIINDLIHEVRALMKAEKQ